MSEQHTLRADLTALPVRMSQLPVDERGYPVPWFVDWLDGKPEFRAMDQRKWIRAVKEKLCWVCGGKMGVNKAFVAGPMCGINRTSSEPPSHLECARYSAVNCPFLNNPRMIRREDEITDNAKLVAKSAGYALSRNPGVTMIWITRTFEIFMDGQDKPLIQMGEPDTVEWYCRGRVATRAEVMESVESGLPSLELLARKQEGASAELARYVRRFEKWVPQL